MYKRTLTELQEINRKLYNSMKAFQIAAEESGSLVFTYDTAKQTIFVDESTAKIFGVAVEQPGVPYDMVGLGIISRDTVEEYVRIHEAVINGAYEAEGVVKLIQTDGKESVQELKFRAILDENGEPTGTAVGVYRDITSRYIRDLEQERYRQALYASGRHTFQYNRKDDILTIHSPLVQNGGKEEKRSYKDFFSILEQGTLCPKNDLVVLKELFSKGSQEMAQIQLYNSKFGTLRWYGITASVAKDKASGERVFGVIVDITDIKVKDEAYRKLERVLQTMKDDYVGIYEIDLEKDFFSILHYSAQNERPLPDQVCYSESLSLISEKVAAPDYRKDFIRFAKNESLRQKLKRNKRVEYEYMSAIEGHPWRRGSFQVAEMRDGEPVTIIMYLADIDGIKSEQMRQQKMIQDACDYAEAASKSKTDFLSRMSHDIRTPMNAIVGMTTIAGNSLEDPRKTRECLNKISSASKHLLSLINEVLDMSKIESGTIELQEDRFNLTDLIDNMITMVLPQINEHGHKLQVFMGDLKHEWVTGDSLRIQQAFVNLISNSVKYTPNGGKIQVTIRERSTPSRNYGEYEFCFEDNGIGMSEEFMKILFEPFSRAEDDRLSNVTGTGLGMAITRNLIRMMDGDIKVESQLDRGSRFTVTIHLKIEDKEEEIPEILVDLPVLVVDDDEIARQNVCLILDDIGMKAEWCSSGEEAIRKVFARHERQDDYFAVILNWKMPDMDGVETVRAISKKVGSDVPIIFLTAYEWYEIEAEARAAGVDKVLSKPLFKSRLVNSFKELVLFHGRKSEEISIFQKDMNFESKRILLVEDNDINAEIVSELLSITRVKVNWAKNGKDAVAMVERAPKDYYDLIFMDIQMPVMDGYEATVAIRNLNRSDVKVLPIVAMTANAFADDVNRAINAGMNEHITKPVDLQQLEAVLQKYL